MGSLLEVERVLGDGPFAEIGEPAAVAAHGPWVAAGGGLGALHWHGDMHPNTYFNPNRLAIYEADGLRLRHLLRPRWPVNAVAFHPDLPLLAIGTGDYDGGFSFKGELLLMNLDTGGVTSLLDEPREVRRVGWGDARTLRLVLAPWTEETPGAFTHGYPLDVERDDWDTAAEHTIAAPGPGGPMVETGVDHAGARRTLAALSETWAPRRQVWDVAALRDGRVLAALEGTLLESWLPSGDREWAVRHRTGGREIEVAPDERSAWVNVAEGHRLVEGRWRPVPGSAVRVSLAGGERLDTYDAGVSVAFAARRDGWLALRDTEYHAESPETVLIGPGKEEAARAQVGPYTTSYHRFRVRRSPDLLFLSGPVDLPVLTGETEAPVHRRWVVSLDVADGRPHPRFPIALGLVPLPETPGRRASVTGGPAVSLPSGALVHGGHFILDRGSVENSAFVARREPDGTVVWLFRTGSWITGLDGDEDLVFASFNSGEVIALDAATGAVLGRRHLADTPLSLVLAGPGRLVIGTAEGRILDCAVTTP